MNALFFLLLSVVGVGSLECLDGVEGEYVAPGWRVIEEEVIDPLAYGEPLRELRGMAEIGIHCSFLSQEEGQSYRIILAYADGIVVCSECDDVRRVALNNSADMCLFSQEGHFLCASNGGFDTRVINTSTLAIHTFGSLRGNAKISDNGNIVIMKDDSLYFYGQDLSLVRSVPCLTRLGFNITGGGEYVVTNQLHTDGTQELYVYTIDGNVLLKKPIGGTQDDVSSFNPVTGSAIPPGSNRLVIADGGLLSVVGTDDGDILYSNMFENPEGLGPFDHPAIEPSCYCAPLNGYLLCFSEYRSRRSSPEPETRSMNKVAYLFMKLEDNDLTYDTLSMWTSEQSYRIGPPIAMGSNGIVLSMVWKDDIRFIATSGERVVWASETIPAYWVSNMDADVLPCNISVILAANSSGNRFAYFDGRYLRIIYLRGGGR